MADKKLELRLLTPAAKSVQAQYKYQGLVDMVIMRGATGDIGFLPGHTACSVVLSDGEMRIIGGEPADVRLAVLGGVAQVENDVLTIITESAEWPEDIDQVRVEANREATLAELARATSPTEQTALREELKRLDLLLEVSKYPPSGVTRGIE